MISLWHNVANNSHCLLKIFKHEMPMLFFDTHVKITYNMTCDFQQCGNLTSLDSDELVQSPFNLRIPNDVLSVG